MAEELYTRSRPPRHQCSRSYVRAITVSSDEEKGTSFRRLSNSMQRPSRHRELGDRRIPPGVEILDEDRMRIRDATGRAIVK
jgi:hypothetical protein